MLILLMTVLVSTAGPVTRRQAMAKVQRLAQKLNISGKNIDMAYASSDHVGSDGLYVFNIGSDDGFVIVSANAETDDILGYSDSGSFDINRIPDNMKAWLSIYEGNIAAVSDGAATPSKVRANHPTKVIAPMITTNWGQQAPLNSLCPFYEGVQCPTGCTATALAQVMYYHRAPKGNCESIPSYITRTSYITMPKLPATTFDWDLMPEDIADDTDSAAIAEVAKLMLYCGQATDMNYNASGSGAYSYKIPERMPQYFGYPNTSHYIYRNAYDEAEWDSLLINELSNNRPVIYTAYTNLSQGHTFICDGYDGNGLYHINWGWFGEGNGYYRISVAHASGENLNPNIKNYQLSGNQTAIVGLKPSGIDDFVAPTTQLKAYTRPSLKNGRHYTREADTKAFTGITFTQSFVNTTLARKTFYQGFALVNDNGSIVSVLKSASATLAAGGTTSLEAANLSIGSNITSGHYTIRPIYKLSSTSQWRLAGNSETNYIDVYINDLDMTLTPVPRADFITNSLSMDGDYLQIDFDNTDENFYGPIYVRKLDPETNTIVTISNDNLSFDANTNRKFEIYLPEADQFNLFEDIFYLSVDEYDTQYFFSSYTTEDNSLTSHIGILNLDADSVVTGERMMAEIQLSNNGTKDFDNIYTVSLIDGDGNITELLRDTVNIAAGDSLSRQLNVALTNYDTTYQIRVSHKTGPYTWVSHTTPALQVQKGAIYWTKDGTIKTLPAAVILKVPEEAVAINLRTAYSYNVTANKNPNLTVPKGVNGKNYVNSANKGPKLKLVDGYDYLIPEPLSFSGAVSYEREFTDSTKFSWTTLSLPFQPTTLTLGDEETTWRNDSVYDSGTFWLYGITGIVDSTSTVTTEDVETIAANTPYVMATDSVVWGKKLTMSASQCTLQPTFDTPRRKVLGRYSFNGTHCKTTPPGSYRIDGDTLVYSADGDEVVAFRAYLQADSVIVDSTQTDSTTVGNIFADKLTIDVTSVIHPQEIPEPGPDPVIVIGDVDANGVINVTDVMLIVENILGGYNPIFLEDRADINGDGIINVTDAQLVVNIILTE